MSSLGWESHQDTYTQLKTAYNQSHRHYHTLKHIKACLTHLEHVKTSLENTNTIELALWFHDAVYKPFSTTNEQDSANWAVEFFKSNGASQEMCDRVQRLILLTASHKEAMDIEEQLMLDIDLSILGSSADVYEQYEKAIRQEYIKVPYFIYRKKRKQILSQFLNDEKIFKHEYFYERLETQARRNLSKALITL